MTYERQRKSALKMITRYGTTGVLEHEVTIPDPDAEWKSTQVVEKTNVRLVAFADDGVTFVNHNITGDVRVLTVVGTSTLAISVGDIIATNNNRFTVKLAKPLDPDLSGAILWAVLAQ